MITFLCGILILIGGYFVYGRWVERQFGVKPARRTPAHAQADGVDYVPMGRRRNALIQLLNIAGVGPIFGPIMGALYGPAAFIWIAIGAVFAGAVHDYLIGMISIRQRGKHLPELAGQYLGNPARHLVNGFTVLLLLLVATVFVSAPARLIFDLVGGEVALGLIVVAIFIYYLVATLLPIDKIIGRCYPFFGAFLLLSAVGVCVMLLVGGAPIPELGAASFSTQHPGGLPIFPMLFLTISCGALSGFHATQSPIISRTLENESQGRFVFYGMMIVEGFIAMIWAAGALALKASGALDGMLTGAEAIGPAGVVKDIALNLLGPVAGAVAIIGVIVLPITSGDTAFRSVRMILGDYLNVGQQPIRNRLVVALPLFGLSIALTFIDFSLLWRYFSWANQTIAALALWTGCLYLVTHGKAFLFALVPAVFITAATLTYIFYAPVGFALGLGISRVMGIGLAIALGVLLVVYARRRRGGEPAVDPVPPAA